MTVVEKSNIELTSEAYHMLAGMSDEFVNMLTTAAFSAAQRDRGPNAVVEARDLKAGAHLLLKAFGNLRDVPALDPLAREALQSLISTIQEIAS
jgi:hypothetical protein